MSLQLGTAVAVIGGNGRRLTGRTFTCEQCGKEFYRYRADIAKAAAQGSHIRFCSKACDIAFKARGNVRCTCEVCGATFDVQANKVRKYRERGWDYSRFCSLACAERGDYRNKKQGYTVPCRTCGKPVYRTAATLRARTYCSRSCFGADQHGRERPSWGVHGTRSDIGHYTRSTWESNICRVLNALGIDYEYEPQTFRTGTTHYTPDLRIGETYVEIKGYLTEKSERKIKAFRKAYPSLPFYMIDEPAYRVIEREWAPRLLAWEFDAFSPSDLRGGVVCH